MSKVPKVTNVSHEPWDDDDVCNTRDPDALRAEVLRLRDVEAAWEWLAQRYDISIEPQELQSGTYSGKDGRFVADCSVPHVNGKPDPVALATALDKDWRVK